jgi:hypothetical protein
MAEPVAERLVGKRPAAGTGPADMPPERVEPMEAPSRNGLCPPAEQRRRPQHHLTGSSSPATRTCILPPRSTQATATPAAPRCGERAHSHRATPPPRRSMNETRPAGERSDPGQHLVEVPSGADHGLRPPGERVAWLPGCGHVQSPCPCWGRPVDPRPRRRADRPGSGAETDRASASLPTS